MTKPWKVKGVRKPFSLIRDKGMCMRFNCVNRDIKCLVCLRRNGEDTEYVNREFSYQV